MTKKIYRFLYASGGRFKMSYTLEAEFNQKWSTAAEKELFALNLGKLTFWFENSHLFMKISFHCSFFPT